MSFKKNILVAAGIFITQWLMAQGGATIKASVDKSKILIGEPIKLTVNAYISTGSAYHFPAIDSIEHFELLGKPSIDTSDADGGINVEHIYTITSFDSGGWVIPSFVISPAFQSDTIPVEVVFSEFDASQDYHDIKDILEVKPAKKIFPWWWYAGGAVLVLLVVLYFIKRKKPIVTEPVQKITVHPYEEAMKSLGKLQQDKPAAKPFYSALTDIFRLYISQRKGISSLQKTTDDLVVQLRNLDITREQFDRLSQSLRLSDFVKFAKYIPTTEDDNNSFDEIKNAITQIEKAAVEQSSLPTNKK